MSTQTAKIVASASLAFCEGSSDKVYHAQIVGDEAAGYVVNFQYGRRGATLQSGSKTASPVALAKAQAVFDKLVKEKMAKGYTTGEDGTPFSGGDQAGRASGLSLQLLNAIERGQARDLLTDSNWGMQQKMDGERRAVRIDADGQVGINRKGLTVALPETVAQAVAQCLPADTIIDGELIGDTLWVFDLLRYKGQFMLDQPYYMRHSALLMAIPGAISGKEPLRVVGLYRTAQEKAGAFERLEKVRAEGVVFKRLASTVTAGRPNSGGDQLKFKFVETATVKVLGMNDGVRSARMGLYDGDRMVEVGNVTIPPNAAVPAAGDLIDVRYLYAYPGGCLFQPVYDKPRTDLDEPAADLGQLKYKSDATPEVALAA
jgi:bifunctional non-homologous end joining protein LigD